MQAILCSIIAAFLVIAAMATSCFAQDYPKATGYVNDFDNLLTQEQKQQLISELKDFDVKTTIEIVIVTVPSLQGYSIEEYAIGLARAWGVGKRDKNNGLVLLVAPNERKVRVEVGHGLEEVLSNSVASSIVRNDILPEFRAGHMGVGIVNGVRGIMRRLSQSASVQPLTVPKASNDQLTSADDLAIVPIFVGLLVAGSIVVVVIVVVGRTRRRREAQERSRTLLNSLPFRFAETHRATGCACITAKTKKRLDALSERFETLRVCNPSQSADWIDLRSKLEGIETELSCVNVAIESDKNVVREAQTEGLKLLKELPQILRDAESEVGGSKKRRKRLDRAWSQYHEAEAVRDNSDPSLIKWLIIYELLTSAHSSVNAEASAGYASSSDSNSGSSGTYDGRSSLDDGFSGGRFDGGGSTGSW